MNNLPGHRPSLPFITANNDVGTSSQPQRTVGSSIFSRPLTMRAGGIMRNRPRPPEQEEPSQPIVLTDSRIDSLITNFVVGNGLPFEVVSSDTFKDLLLNLSPRLVLPTVKVIESCSEKMGNPGKPIVNYQKTTGPLSVTLHVTNVNHKHYLAFSIHYFNEARNRRDVIYLRELMLSRLDETSLLTTLRRAVSAYNYANVKFTNLVVPDQEVFALLNNTDIVKRSYVCFYNYMSTFVRKILAIDVYVQGLQQLRLFVESVSENADDYSKFRRLQLTKNAELDLPALDNHVWESTAVFLTRCLILHDTFVEFVDRCRISNYINNEMFLKLVGLHRILQRCVKYSRNVSTYTSSISQITPTVYGLHNFIQQCDVGETSQIIRSSFTSVFSPLTSPPLSDRFEIATLLDPRFAYREHAYGLQQWSHYEKKLINDFADYQSSHNSERNFDVDVASMSRDERVIMIQQELKLYRHLIITQRPEEYHNPFTWWIRNCEELDVLAVLAREHLACPAVAIDADFHFAPGGKFSHVCQNYSHQLVENVLNAAGVHQKFRGRGASIDFIQPRQIEHLNSVATRRQKEYNMNNYATHDTMHIRQEPKLSDTERLLRNQSTPDVEGKPENIEMNSQPQTLSQMPNIVVRKRTPAILEEEEDIKPDINLLACKPNMNETKDELHLQLSSSGTTLTNQSDDLVETQQHTPAPSSIPSDEQKPDNLSLNEVKKEIKEEPLDEDDIQMQPLAVPKPTIVPGRRIVVSSMSKPAGVAGTSGGGKVVFVKSANGNIATKTAVIFPPNRPNPQIVQRANFVQKFAQKQNFVQKFVAKKPEITGPKSQQMAKPSWTAGVKITREEGKPTRLHFASSPSTSINFNQTGAERSEENKYFAQRPRKPCNRRCAVCSSMEEHENLKNVTIDSEKLMIVLGATYRSEMSMAEARKCLERNTKTYMCRVHFTEACDEIFKMLRVNTPEGIATCSVDLINNALITVSQLRQRQMTVPDLRKCLVNFVTKYWDEPSTAEPEKDEEEDESPEHEVGEETDIVPKTFRQPRKQVLEEDQHDATVKLIEQEDFKLPKVKPISNTTSTAFEQPEFCCYCSEHNNRNDMVRVPRSEERVIRWLHALGQEFGSRLKPDCENFICRSHFAANSFSSRGRLLKGMLPNVQPDKVEVTYKIQGTSFLKLGEEKSGREKDARFNLENEKEYGSEDESEYSDEEDGGLELKPAERLPTGPSTSTEAAHSSIDDTVFTNSLSPENRAGVKRSTTPEKVDSVPPKRQKSVQPPSRSSARINKKT